MKSLKKYLPLLFLFSFYGTGFSQNIVPELIDSSYVFATPPWNSSLIVTHDPADGTLQFNQNGWSFGGDSMIHLTPLPPNGVVSNELLTQDSRATRSFQTQDNNKLYLKFNQSFTKFQSNAALGSFAQIQVKYPNQAEFVSYRINSNIGGGSFTSPNEEVIVDISTISPIPINTSIDVTFQYFGYGSQWVVRNVELWNYFPTTTIPSYIGDTLSGFGYPIGVDAAGGSYVPNQLIVRYKPGTAQSYKDSLQNEYPITVRTCMCGSGDFELWELGGDELGIIDINEIKPKASAESEVEEVNFNYYNYDEIKKFPINMNYDTINSSYLMDSIPATTKDDIIIAILDTGIDYHHPDLKDYIWWNNNYDSDDNCMDDDYIGWNFVKDTRDVFDPHSHGTHVAGIVVESLKLYNPSCNFKIMPLATHDENGVATLFNILCALEYAMMENVDVINASWGYIAEPSDLMESVIKKGIEKDILFITSAGNEHFKLDVINQYPAVIGLDNIITVGAIDSADNLDYFSNFYCEHVNIGSPGKNIRSTIPFNYGYKTGTSMSAPLVTAAAALMYCKGYTDYADVRDQVYSCSDINSKLEADCLIEKGRILNLECVDNIPEYSQPGLPVSTIFCMIAILFILIGGWFYFRRRGS